MTQTVLHAKFSALYLNNEMRVDQPNRPRINSTSSDRDRRARPIEKYQFDRAFIISIMNVCGDTCILTTSKRLKYKISCNKQHHVKRLLLILSRCCQQRSLNEFGTKLADFRQPLRLPVLVNARTYYNNQTIRRYVPERPPSVYLPNKDRVKKTLDRLKLGDGV